MSLRLRRLLWASASSPVELLGPVEVPLVVRILLASPPSWRLVKSQLEEENDN